MKKILSFIFVVTVPFLAVAQWTDQVSGTTEDLHDIYFVNENTGYCVGANGTILKTTNGGDVWTSLSSDITTNIDFVYFVNENRGWISSSLISSSTLIYQTDDGGATFFSLENVFRDIYNINPDDQMGLATMVGVKDNIVIFCAVFSSVTYRIITTDGGSTWSSFNLPANLYSVVSIVNENVFFASDYSPNHILKSTDGGISWEQMTGATFSSVPYSHKCFKIFDIHGNGLAFVSLSWNPQNITHIAENTIDITANNVVLSPRASFLSNNTGYFVRSAPSNQTQVFKSTDGGYTYELLSLTPSSTQGFMSGIHFINEQTGFVCGQNGKIHKTTTGGLSVNELKKTTLKIYPNPAKEKINLVFSDDIEIENIQFLDMTGKVVKTHKSNFNEIDIQDLEKGIYLLSVKTINNIITQKVVVE